MFAAAMVGVALHAWLTGAPAVRWLAPPECPDAATFHRRVDRRLAEAGVEGRADLEIEITVVHETGAYVLRVVSIVAADRQERVVVGASCEEVTGAAVLITALALDPRTTSRWGETPTTEVPASPIPEPPSTASASSEGGEPDGAARIAAPADTDPVASSVGPSHGVAPPPPERATTPARGRAVPLAPVVAADVGLVFGALSVPLPMATVRVAAGVDRGRLRWLARVSASGPSVGSLGPGRPGSVAGLGAVGTLLCVHAGPDPHASPRWRWLACATTDLGLVGARGRGTRETASRRAVSWALGGELGVERVLRSALALAVRAHASGYPATPTFVVEGQPSGAEAVCCAAWSAGLTLGLVGRWPPAR